MTQFDPPKPTPSATTSPPVGLTAGQQSAKGIIDSFLTQYGLQGLGDKAWGYFLGGQSTDQIFLTLQDTPEWQQRFPAMKQLAQQGHAISPAEYIAYEKSYAQVLQTAGVPQGFSDSRQDIAEALTNNVSISEIQQRVDIAKTAAYQSPPEVLDALHNFYGVTPRAGSVMGDLTAFYIDPQKALPVIQQQFAAAQDAGSAQRSGYGQIDQAQAERLAALGINQQQADTGFANLANLQQVFNPLAGQAGAGISQDQQLAAQFGSDAAAQAAIKAAQQARLNTFQGGGGFQRTQQGSTGIGVSQ